MRPEGLPDYMSYAVADGLELRPPAWTTRPGLWERVLEVVDAGPPETRTCFIHRDYHPWNTLTVDDRVVAVVDWPTAAWGPPGIDLARMRLNLVEEVARPAPTRSSWPTERRAATLTTGIRTGTCAMPPTA